MRTNMKVLLAIALALVSANAQRAAAAGEHWVSAWAIAQPLRPTTIPTPPVLRDPPQMPPRPAAAPGAGGGGRGRGGGGGRTPMPAKFSNQTIRMVVRPGLAGRQLRVELSNMVETTSLVAGEVHVAVAAADGATVEGTDHVLTFSGQRAVELRPGVLMVSDPLTMTVTPSSDLAISIFVPGETGVPTVHRQNDAIAYIAEGNTAAAAAMTGATTANGFYYVSSVDVLAPENNYAIAAVGDSLTDGGASWAMRLGKRLSADPNGRRFSVINLGWAGNELLKQGNGVSALERFDRDVLSRPGVAWMVILESVNDLQLHAVQDDPDAIGGSDLIAGYKQLIERAHMHGIKVVGATVTPYSGVRLWSKRGEAARQEVNKWIRTPGSFDAFVDLDAVVRDPAQPERLKADLDSGDHIHPSPAGQEALSQAFDLSIFTKGTK